MCRRRCRSSCWCWEPASGGGGTVSNPFAGHKVRDTQDLQDWLNTDLYPALFKCLDSAFPEFDWTQRGSHWEANTWPPGFPYPVNHENPSRLMVYPDRPWWIKVHGHEGVRFLELVSGERRPRGDAFVRACRDLARLAGVQFPERERTPEQIAAEDARQERRDFLEAVIDIAASALWADHPDSKVALAYLRNRRRLTDEQIREFRLGYLRHVDPAKDLATQLQERGFHPLYVASHLPAYYQLSHYITIPWMDELARPLTLYGRWPGDDFPEMNSMRGWKDKRDAALSAWEKSDKSKPWEEPRIPKTTALAGADSKCSPLYLDRARRAGHREVVVVEGLLDALMLQAHGETRAVAAVAAQLSGEQVKTLQRCRIEKAFICGDPDGGGDRGTSGNVISLAKAGITPYVVPRLPDGLDPDEYILRDGIEAWQERVKQSQHGYRHLGEQVIAGHKAGMGERRDAGDDLWCDQLADVAVKQAIERLPVERPDWLRYYFEPISVQVPYSVEELRGRVQHSQQGKSASQNGDPNSAGTATAGERQPYKPKWWTTADLVAKDWRARWLVKKMLVKDELAIVGAPKKSLKTTLMIELNVSLGSGKPFLGAVPVDGQFRTAMISGETGEFITKETILRVCDAKGIRPNQVSTHWCFTLPRLSDVADLASLQAFLREEKIEVFTLDPLYLALLVGNPDAKASSIFDMGPLLATVNAICKEVGTTPILVHHATKGLKPGEIMELDHLSFSGCAEYARQWLLINRREAYKPGSGVHKLWMSCGGPAVSGGLYSIDVDEGSMDEDFSGRKWEVTVERGGETLKRMKDEKQAAKDEKAEREINDDCSTILVTLDKNDPNRKGITLNNLRDHAAFKRTNDRFNIAIARLVSLGCIQKCDVEFQSGRGGKTTKTAPGVRRPPLNPEVDWTPDAPDEPPDEPPGEPADQPRNPFVMRAGEEPIPY